MRSNNRKILIYLVNFRRGGSEWVVTNLANEMVDRDINVTLVSVKNGDMFGELNEKIDAFHFEGSFLKAFLFLLKSLRKNNYNALFTTQRGASMFAGILRSLTFTQTRFVVREPASNFIFSINNKPKYIQWLWKILFKFSYNSADKIIVNSPDTKKDLISAGIITVDKKNVVHINNPVDVDLIIKRSKLDVSNNLDFNKKTIVSVARLVPKKNMDLLIKAFDIVQKKFSETQLIIIGDGPEMENLKYLVSSLNINDNVIFTGRLDNPFPILSKSDIFVLASEWEGFGMVIVEALALNIPVIASNIDSGPKVILENGKWGTLFPVGSVEKLTEAILKQFTNNKRQLNLRDRAYHFDKRKISRIYIEEIF